MIERVFIFCLIVFGLTVSVNAVEIGTPYEFSSNIKPGDTFMNVRLLGALKLSTDQINNFGARELSGLAWDDDQQILYAVSDDGYLVHLKPSFTGDLLTGVEFIDAYALRGPDNKPLEGKASDAESLTILNGTNGVQGDTEVIVGLEFPPRITKYRTNGEFITAVPLPDYLADINSYSDKKSTINALALHPEYGFITAPQKPLNNSSPGYLSIYSLEGREWQYKPLSNKSSFTLGLDTLPDGNLLVLERVYSSVFKPVIYALRKLKINNTNGSTLTVDEIAHFNSRQGWSIDNFEGISKHQDNRYFMVSDDNESVLQKTLLIYFELINKE
ncbi:MAG: esterase-like activity of phytase family protein [Gammaproteobacteria bacterium]